MKEFAGLYCINIYYLLTCINRISLGCELLFGQNKAIKAIVLAPGHCDLHFHHYLILCTLGDKETICILIDYHINHSWLQSLSEH